MEAQKGRWDGAGPCRLGPDLQAGYSCDRHEHWEFWIVVAPPTKEQGGCGSREERCLWWQCRWGWAVIIARKNQHSASRRERECQGQVHETASTLGEHVLSSSDWLLGSSLGQHRTDEDLKALFAYDPGASLVAQMVKCLPATRETQVRSQSQEYPLEKEMATHSSTLAWKVPWTEEPGRLQSMRLQRVGHG